MSTVDLLLQLHNARRSGVLCFPRRGTSPASPSLPFRFLPVTFHPTSRCLDSASPSRSCAGPSNKIRSLGQLVLDLCSCCTPSNLYSKHPFTKTRSPSLGAGKGRSRLDSLTGFQGDLCNFLSGPVGNWIVGKVLASQGRLPQ